MRAPRLLALLLLLALPCFSAEKSATAPEVVRGRLSLAWDAYDSERFEEALNYLGDVAPPKELAPEVIELRAYCLERLNRFPEAAKALSAPGAKDVPQWNALWEEVILAWAASREQKQDYRGAAKALETGRRKLPSSALLDAASRAVSYRAELAAAVALSIGQPRVLSGGGVLQVLPVSRQPEEGSGDWYQWCPPQEGAFWVAHADCFQWMPATAKRLRKEGRAAWLNVPAGDFDQLLRFEAAERNWKAVQEGPDTFIEREGGREVLDVEAWRARAALEGWGLRGAALMAVEEADAASRREESLKTWVKSNKGKLGVADRGGNLVLSDPRSGRSFTLDLAGWGEFFAQNPDDWRAFWNDMTEELARPARAFRCFCGRETVLRETVVPDGKGLIADEAARDHAVVLEAHCPKHWFFVTEETLRAWGVTTRDAFVEAERQAVKTPWNLRFDRGLADGQPYLLLTGPSASGLWRTPEVLLSVLDSVEGGGYSGRTVSIWTPTAETLVVGERGASEAVGVAGARRAVSYFGGVSSLSGPIDHRRDVSLPLRAAGSCNLERMETP